MGAEQIPQCVRQIHPEIIRTVAERLKKHLKRPDPPQHLIDWSRTINITEGDFPGIFDPERHAAQYYLMQAIGDGLLGRSIFRHFAGKKPTQDGGTLVGHVMPQIYTAAVLHDPVVIGYPDMGLCGKHWRSKFRPLVREIDKTWLPTAGIGSEESSRVDEIRLNGTSVYWIGGGASNEAGQSMVTGRLVTRDEVDSMEPYVFRLMLRRNDGYRKRNRDITIDISTVKLDHGSLIESTLSKSTDAHVEYACPYCTRFVHWDWDTHVDFDDTTEISSMQTVHLACPHADCKAQISEADREAMLKLSNSRLVMKGQKVDEHGNVTGPAPEVATWGITWSALDSPLISLASLAQEYWKANEDLKAGDPSSMRSFYRDRLSRIYKDTSKPVELTLKHLQDLSTESPYDAGVVPAWSDFLSGGCDVQLRWIYWWVEAYDRTMRSHLVASGSETITHLDGSEISDQEIPTREERREALRRIDQLFENGWELEGNRSQRINVLLRTVDVGYLQDDVRFFLHDHAHWNPVKGEGDDDADQPVSKSEGAKLDGKRPWYEARLQFDDYGEWTLWRVTGDLVKGYIQNGYLIKSGARSRTLHFGLRTNSAPCRHLVSERRVEYRGRMVYRKVTSGAANHFLDCAVYAAAMARAYIVVRWPELPPPPPPAAQRSELPAAQQGRAVTFNRRHSRLARRGG